MSKSKGLKKILLCGVYLLLSILCIGVIFTLISLTNKKTNDSIVRASENSSEYTNINPNFVVDFVDGKYVRFETVSSYIDIEKKDKPSIWEKIRYKLGIRQERKGLEISLLEVSYDKEMIGLLDMELTASENIKRGFELTQMGREIGGDEKKIVSKDTVIAKDIYKGVDIEYQVIEGKGLKEEIVLNELAQYSSACDGSECVLPVNRFLFEIKLDEGLTLNRSIDGGGTYPNGFTYVSDEKGNYFAHFLPEYALDSVGVKTSNVASNILQTDSGIFVYEIILDPEWLLSNERVFPIRIDPSIVHDSQVLFDEGSYERVYTDPLQTVRLNSDAISGTYTSSVLQLEENGVLQTIGWQGFSQASQSIEEPFSRMDLVYEENFNTELSEKIKYGEGSLYLAVDENRRLEINTAVKESITIEFWSYKRYLSNSQELFLSNLGSLKIVENSYVFEDVNGIQYSTDISVKYNDWQYISIVFTISNSSISIYIDEAEYKGDVGYGTENLLGYIDFKGSGYIDTVRVYERLLAKNELLSNSMFGDISMQYMSSSNGLSWEQWVSKSQYIPQPIEQEGYLHIQTVEESIDSYKTLSFEYLSDTEKEIVMGSSKFENGDSDDTTEVLDPLLSSTETPIEAKYLDMRFTPVIVESSCLLSAGGLEVHSLDSGKIDVVINGVSSVVDDMYLLNTPNYLSLSFKPDGTDIYLNGNRVSTSQILPLSVSTYGIGSGCIDGMSSYTGEINNVRVSNLEKSQELIYSYHNLEGRRYILTPQFRANLQNDTQIQSLETSSFSINQMPFGATNYIVNLNIGDMIVISQDEFKAQGRVKELDVDTGLVVLGSWEQESTIPTGGFTSSANVLKWESIYIPTKYFTNSSNTTNEVYLKYEDIKIKDIKFFSGFKSDESISTEFSGTPYIRYRLIFVSSIYGFSPYISSVNIDYETSGPTMDQIMRHGQWFNEEGKQPYWWSK